MDEWQPIRGRVTNIIGLLQIGLISVSLGVACAPLSRSTSDQVAESGAAGVYRIAIAHVMIAPEMHRRDAEGRNLNSEAATDNSQAATDIGRFFSQALVKRGVEVVWAHSIRGIPVHNGSPPEFHHEASRLARASLESFDVDALLVIELKRWSPRDMGSSRREPAAVTFRATLHGGPEGLMLWSGEFSERQVTLLGDPLRALRYPGRGTRWLTASELAQWGANSLASEIPLHGASNRP